MRIEKKRNPGLIEDCNKNPYWEMDDFEDPNKVLMDGIGMAFKVHLGEEVGFILGCKQAWSEATSSPC